MAFEQYLTGEVAGRDRRARAAAALVVARLEHEIRTFAGVDHGFFNDTARRYGEAAARGAYALLLGGSGEHLA